MMTTNSLKDEFTTNSKDNLDCAHNELEISETSSDVESEISLSEKIVFESNEKRLRKRMTTLQTSIMNLKEQLKMEKELWKEDIEKIKAVQKQQEMKCTCPLHQTKSKEIFQTEDPNRSCNIYSLMRYESGHHISKHPSDEILKTQSIKQLLELQNYKRKLAETENMCNVELLRIKQSLQDLKSLKNITLEWDKNEKEEKDNLSKLISETDNIQEIFVANNNG